MNQDLDNVIEDSLNDSVAEPIEDTTEVETSEITAEATNDVESIATEPVEDTHPRPGGAAADPTVQDEFAKRHGLQANSVTGRENRIPYSRVKKIVGKVEAEALKVKTELDTIKPKFTEYETKIQDYEGRLERVAQFENILQNDPRQFLQMLSQVPAYQQFFEYVANAVNGSTTTPAAEQPYLDVSQMPQPNEVLSDGSRVYSLEGLAKRDEWLARQIEAKAVSQAEARIAERYKPLEQEWQSREQYNRIVPVVEKQITEARTWPHFSENEAAIVTALKADQNLTLEGAYRQVMNTVVMPRLAVDRDRMRTELLAEIKKKPVASSTPVGQVRSTTRFDANATSNRSLEDVIAQAVADSGQK